MKRYGLTLAALLAFGLAGPVAGQEPAERPRPTSTVDAQFLDASEYLIASGELRWAGEFVAVGTILSLPTATLRGQAQFHVMGHGGGWEAGDRAWTNNYFRTRAARPADLVVGKPVFCLNETTEQGVFRGPRNRLEALNSGWWATIITDVSALDRGEVTAGRSRLGISCLRVLR